ncbi:MAG: hypothetical protein AAFX09_01410 [Pseudomonadota bacterium]
MSARPFDSAALVIADKHAARIAIARGPSGLYLPEAKIAATAHPSPKMRQISDGRLGSSKAKAACFADAALMAGFEHLGWLIARPTEPSPQHGSTRSLDRIRLHGLEPGRGDLVFLGRALSPAHQKRRRHVRVFAAPFAAVSNSVVRPARAQSVAWLTPAEASEELDDDLLGPLAARALDAFSARFKPHLVSFRAGRRLVRAL